MAEEMFWYNFKTGEYELASPTDYTDYLPPLAAARNLYRLYLETGVSPLDAAIRVLTACCLPTGQARVSAT